jgi:hypothetical protein
MFTSNRRLKGALAGALTLMAVTAAMPASATELEIGPIAAPQKTFSKMVDTSDAWAKRKRIAGRQFIRMAAADDMRTPACPRLLCLGLMLGVGF